MFDKTMTPNDLVFDIPVIAPFPLSPLSHMSIHPLPFLGASPRRLYDGAIVASKKSRKKHRLKQLLIPYFRRMGYTGTMEQATDASPIAHS